ncbi:unnamed protein product [Clavelina lepadiformis]|uniref:Poly(ADP-ribose) glycohydrolase n=1 Tax=Clavelina lepadiformis TaxID=159417 RepID=A0ABP0FPE7_CLALP
MALCTIVPRLSNLTKHEETEKHRKNTPSSFSNSLRYPLVTEAQRQGDSEFSLRKEELEAFLACVFFEEF